MKYIPYVAAEQPINKQFLQMERNILDRDVVGCILDDSVVFEENGYCQIFWSEPGIEQLKKDGEKLLDHSQRKKTKDDQLKAVVVYWKEAENLLAKVKIKADMQQLGKAYDKYSTALRRVYAHFITSTAYPCNPIETNLKSLLEKNLSADINSAYEILTTPVEDDAILREKRDWYNLPLNPDNKILIQHYIKNSVVLANIFSEEEVIKLARERLNSSSMDKLRLELETSDNNKKNLKHKKELLLKEINNDEVKEISEFLCDLSILRLKLKHCWNGESFHMLPFFEFLSEKTGISVKEIYMFLTRKEISDFLNKGVPISKLMLTDREQHCFLYYHYDKIEIFDGKIALEKKKQILDPSLPKNDITSFKGSVACKGKVVGKAKIVKVDNPNKIAEVAKQLDSDSILVTGMTNPTMMVLINKVKGIITDEGGIACHAAIIAREHKLPCIVGCNIATHVLKNDDLILLDADNGIVIKLSEDEYLNLSKN